MPLDWWRNVQLHSLNLLSLRRPDMRIHSFISWPCIGRIKSACGTDTHKYSLSSVIQIVQSSRHVREHSLSDLLFCFAVCYLMSRGIFALVGLTDSSAMSMVNSLSRTFHMPYITASTPTNDSTSWLPSDKHYTLHMRPLYDKAMIAMILKYQWNHVHYVYDSKEGKFKGLW